MSTKFRLAGVLRLRRLEEDTAKARLASAHADLAQTVEEAGGLSAYLESSPDRATTGASLAAIAASRAATSAMFAALEAEARRKSAEVDAAFSGLQGARTARLGLEKLEDRHDQDVARAEGRAEQVTLDEVASSTWRPTTGRTTGA
ncbi:MULTISPECIES: flagellar export protein FliJ [Oerskovia]|uniref:Flagellar FliJ protein n=2 Tax=Oerskovia TaxID=162491 RepID=A0ABR8V590_9CELL|nr:MULTISPECIES: flagellar FliJ family protein [Oerskovia]MBD7999937.1 flagellar FliJ family protein [Oerskovia gallyi]MBM7496282.1 flagellar FliJ protein [Oerskovia paurometabola]